MGIRLTICFFLAGSVLAFGQSRSIASKAIKPQYSISWGGAISSKISDQETVRFLSFPDAQYAFSDGFLPRYFQEVPVSPGDRNIQATLVNASYESLTDEEASLIRDPSLITNSIRLSASVGLIKKKPMGVVSFIPIRRNPSTGKYEKLVSFDLQTTALPSTPSTRALHSYASNSVLQSGDWYRISLNADGVYRLSYTFLQDLGLDMSTLVPANIRIYGNGGGMLNPDNSAARPDDLIENPIVVQDGGDGTFDPSDYVLFYGQGPHRWKPAAVDECNRFQHITNIYSDSTFYFITASLGPGKRITTRTSSATPPTHIVNSFDDYAFHENESVNFIKSGSLWFGEYFDNIATYNFPFSFPNIDASRPVTVKTSIASRLVGGGSNANYSISCQSGFASLAISPTAGDSYAPYANIESACFSFAPTSSVMTVTVNKLTPNAVAWLDYVEVSARRQLTMAGSQMHFRDSSSVGPGNVSQFNLTSSQPVTVWDVTDPTNAENVALTIAGSLNQFVAETDVLHEFVAVTGASYLTPKPSQKVINQDLHAITQKEMLIVAHPLFMDEALELAAFHESHDTLSTIVVTPQQIYNEFSSGAQDPVAIRHFAKMFYDRAGSPAEMPLYLLLFGDGSYDNKNRFGAGNTNFIPTYQSDNSTVFTESYVSDDYYGLLDDTEGNFYAVVPTNEYVDIGIGRLPVKSKAEARNYLTKMYAYTKTGLPPMTSNTNGCEVGQNASPFGDWRNVICFVGDDEDGGLHQGSPPSYAGADQLAVMVDTTHNDYNIDKIYLDAYKQESTPGGERYPEVSKAIDQRIEKGCLIFNYTGHGGEVGLAHERIVEVGQINKWENINNLPLFFTATCEFSRFDDPGRTSAGEYVFLNPNGGAIALLTTVRLVFATPNFTVNKNFFRAAFTPINGHMPRLGDLYEFMKDQPGGNYVNSRNFTLLGDPALTLSYPKYEVVTDSVNNNLVTTSSVDTVKALSLLTVSGHLRDGSGATLTNYNGVLYPTVYDKAQSITTLSNDGLGSSPPFTFKLQKNILYRGKVSVTNGHFSFSFVVPKDIAYAFGTGRISYYAENGSEDANGFYEKIIIGGSNDSAASDNAGPEVSLYMNDNKFVYGGLTDENPDLYAVMKDANGINTVGNGIGHDITAVLDANTDDVIVLNDFYQADLNSYKSGAIRYPFNELSEGRHTLSLKVWDVYNNSSQSYTEFVVSKSADLALDHVLNYPNPFTTKTQFYFEQNRCCQSLEVELQVFTISGKLVKSFSKIVQAEGYRSDPIEWDGRDDFGDKIGKGVYIYKLKVKADDGSSAEKFEKLVILN